MKTRLLSRAVLAVCGLALGTTSARAEIWGLKSYAAPSIASGPPTALFHFSESGSIPVDVGDVTLNGIQIDADALAMRGNQLYAYQLIWNTDTNTNTKAVASSQLISINSANAVATTIGNALTGRDMRGATFDSAGRLLTIDAASNELLQINPATGNVISAVSLTLGGSPFATSDGTDIAQRSDGTYFISAYVQAANVWQTQILTVNISTGAMTLVHTDPTNDPDGNYPVFFPGIAFSPAAPPNILFGYEANGSDDIYTYNTTGGYARNRLIHNFISDSNAGRGDLAAPIPLPNAALMGGLGLAALVAARKLRTRKS